MCAKARRKNFVKTVEKVFSIMAHTSDFARSSDEEKISMMLSYLLDMGVPFFIAIRIAYRVLERIKHRKAYI